MREYLALTDLIADIGILIAVVACTAFVASYATFFNWRLTAAGRALMYFVVALLSVAVIASLGRWLGPEYFGRELLRPLTWLAVAGTSTRLTVVLWTSSRRGRSLDISSRPRKGAVQKESTHD